MLRPASRRVTRSIVGWLIVLAIIGGSAYYYRAQISDFYRLLLQRFLPCQQPIHYSIGTLDKRFGLSEKQLLAAIAEAEKIWETAAKKDLFVYDPQGALTINLIYDDRQAATQQLNKLGIVIGDDQKTYDQLQAKYAAAKADYTKKKAEYDALLAQYKIKQAAYEKEVNTLNHRGGATPEQYKQLEQERLALNAMVDKINALQSTVNALVDTVNALANTLNRLAYQLNLSVNKYNTIGATQGAEYNEGLYKSGPGGSEIDIFQFENHNKLVRVLAHEMGHALGLAHVDDPKAIMYRLNQGKNETPTDADIAELTRQCQLP